MEIRRFELNQEQIDFLKKEYSENDLVQKILETEEDKVFEIDVDAKIDFMDFIEDESIYWMDEDYEATQKTIMLESIRDDIYYQTN
jgi:hypothetical protein|uniref:Uncharacterized protein n=1 Tax=Siphoviridae sp. ct7BG1 TaxID=2825349 RepID=A0A8S5U4G9_9CAUD|nr:MAG TPA: hypothetical protein [Siphoviridae sp. ct7BG1]